MLDIMRNKHAIVVSMMLVFLVTHSHLVIAGIPGYSEEWSVNVGVSVLDMDVSSYILAVKSSEVKVFNNEGVNVSLFSLNFTATRGDIRYSNIIIGASNKAYLYALDGTLRRIYNVPNLKDVAVSSSKVVIANTSGIYVYDFDGNLVWNKTEIGSIKIVEVTSDSVFVAKDRLYKFSLSGDLLWNISLGSEVLDIYPVSSSEVYIGTVDSLIKVSGGTISWQKNYSTPIQTVVMCNNIVIAFSGSMAYAYDRTGELVWSTDTGLDVIMARCMGDRLIIATSSTIRSFIKVAGITVSSTPSGATVYIDGNRVGETPLTLELDPGSHKIRLEYDGYTITDSFSLEPGEMLPLNYVFDGTIKVTSTPSEAEVYLGEDYLGLTPLQVDVKPGTYLLLLKYKGYTWKKTVEIKPAKLTKVTAVFNGTIFVETQPQNISVKIDGKNVGRTPLKVDVIPGYHHVAIIYNNETLIKNVNVKPAEITRISVIFNATLYLDIVPRSAEVYIGTRKIDVTNGYYDVDPGEYAVTIYCGGKMWKKVFRLSAGQNEYVKVVFNSTLKISSVPKGAEVYINGSRVGVTPLEKNVETLTYVVEIRFQNQTVRKTVVFDTCEPKEVNVVFNKTITIATFPSGIPVSIDSVPIGTSPLTTTVSLGNHTFSARWIIFEKSVNINILPDTEKVSISIWEPIAFIGALIAVAVIIPIAKLILSSKRERLSYRYTYRNIKEEPEERYEEVYDEYEW